MPDTIIYRAGQPIPEGVVLRPREGQEPEACAKLKNGNLFPLEDGDCLTVEAGVVTWVAFGTGNTS